MSRIGGTPINIPEAVTVTITGGEVTIKGPQGELQHSLPTVIQAHQTGSQLLVSRRKDDKKSKALHGLSRSLLANMVIGVNQGYSKTLELVGTGYRASQQQDDLSLNLGFSHPVEIRQPPNIKFKLEGNNKIIISGIDKQQVGQIAAEIRSFSKPEPYKGKGIRYQDEVVRRKPGKAAKVGAAGES